MPNVNNGELWLAKSKWDAVYLRIRREGGDDARATQKADEAAPLWAAERASCPMPRAGVDDDGETAWRRVFAMTIRATSDKARAIEQADKACPRYARWRRSNEPAAVADREVRRSKSRPEINEFYRRLKRDGIDPRTLERKP